MKTKLDTVDDKNELKKLIEKSTNQIYKTSSKKTL